MDFSTLFPWILTSLNCLDVTELSTDPQSPWTEDELFNYASEALQDIGGRYLLNVQMGSIPLVAGQDRYTLDPLHIATIYATVGGAMLRPSSVAEIEALDDSWMTAPPGTPTRWIGNLLGLSTFTVYPPPSTVQSLTLFFQQQPTEITPTAPSVDMPAPVGDYLVMRLLEQARSRQGELEMPDVAEALGSVAKVYEEAMMSYWGKGGT